MSTEPPAEQEAFDAPYAYDAVVVPRYARHFADLLLAAVDVPSRANVLELACRTGAITRLLLDKARDGRLVAIDDDAAFLAAARARLGEETGRRLFFKEERVEALPFGEAVFSNVVGNLVDRATTDRGAMLAEVARVLRPKGQLVLTMPLRGSFIEVVDVFREVALKHDLTAVGERVEQYAASMPTPDVWRAEVESHGFAVAGVTEHTFALTFAPGEALFMDPATLAAAAPEWQWCALGAEDPAAVLYSVQDAIQTYFHGRAFELTVVAGCVAARRAGA